MYEYASIYGSSKALRAGPVSVYVRTKFSTFESTKFSILYRKSSKALRVNKALRALRARYPIASCYLNLGCTQSTEPYMYLPAPRAIG